MSQAVAADTPEPCYEQQSNSSNDQEVHFDQQSQDKEVEAMSPQSYSAAHLEMAPTTADDAMSHGRLHIDETISHHRQAAAQMSDGQSHQTSAQQRAAAPNGAWKAKSDRKTGMSFVGNVGHWQCALTIIKKLHCQRAAHVPGLWL